MRRNECTTLTFICKCLSRFDFSRKTYFSHNPFFLTYHTTTESIPKQSYQYTEEVLSSHLATLLQQKDSYNFPAVFRKTRQIHAQITVNGLHNMGILGTRVLGMYILCNNYFDAKHLFCQLQLRYAAPWNWMIRAFTVQGYFDFAILFYFKMLIFGTSPDKYTFPYLIKACGGLHSVNLAKYVHSMIKDSGFELDVYVGSALVKFYTENGCLEIARNLFDKLPQRDIVLWNVMLNGYLKHEYLADNVVKLFAEMRKSHVEPNSVTYTCVLSFCGSNSVLGIGIQLHSLVLKCGLEMDSPVANTMITMYAKCRHLFNARKLFNLVRDADLVTWNGMIGGYVQNGSMTDALDLLREMISSDFKPDSVTFASLLPSVPEVGSFGLGKEIHGYIVRHEVLMDLFLKNALIDTYFKCKNAEMACKIFEQTNEVDIVICTAMISGLVLNGMNTEAIEIFRLLLSKKFRPNAVTLASVLPAATGVTAIKLGKELHGYAIKTALEGRCYVGSALTDMYAKCGNLDIAHQVFLRMSERDSICWNSIITSCSQNSKPKLAIDLFRQMSIEGAKYDCVSISAVLSACGNLSAFHHGKEVHAFMIRAGFNFDIFSSTALIDTYAKCGNLDMAQNVFDAMESKNEVSWNSIIAAYGNHGELKQCLMLFKEMENAGFQPDHVTFLAIISACGHSGKVEEGKHYFNSMSHDYGIAPRMEHYACFIDLLGRAGRLEDATRVIENMPFTPDAGIWGTLLGACRVHGNAELSEVASKHLFEMDPQNSGYYVLLANLHADSRKWERVNEIRDIMKERGVQKVPGYSWIEVNNSSNMFAAADKSHPQSSEIYLLLNNLNVELQNEGYVPQLNSPI